MISWRDHCFKNGNLQGLHFKHTSFVPLGIVATVYTLEPRLLFVIMDLWVEMRLPGKVIENYFLFCMIFVNFCLSS